MNESAQAAIGAQNQAVLEFFETELAEVRFPDLDLETLRAAAEQVQSLASEVERAEALLRSTQAALEQAQAQLGLRCVRAVSYARVYAEEHPQLNERLEGLLPPKARRAKGETEGEGEPKRARRKGKGTELSAASLFHEGPEREDSMLQAM